MEQHPITKAIRIQTERTNEMEHATPMYLTSSFVFDNAEDMRAAFADETDDNIYSRFSNPGVRCVPWRAPKQVLLLLPA
jgi:O-succinylhomoserine sulfhydrylase